MDGMLHKGTTSTSTLYHLRLYFTKNPGHVIERVFFTIQARSISP